MPNVRRRVDRGEQALVGGDVCAPVVHRVGQVAQRLPTWTTSPVSPACSSPGVRAIYRTQVPQPPPTEHDSRVPLRILRQGEAQVTAHKPVPPMTSTDPIRTSLGLSRSCARQAPARPARSSRACPPTLRPPPLPDENSGTTSKGLLDVLAQRRSRRGACMEAIKCGGVVDGATLVAYHPAQKPGDADYKSLSHTPTLPATLCGL